MSSTARDDAMPVEASQKIELAVGGMTCGSCATRIERKLNKLGGVTASVNFATEKASIQAPPAVAIEDIVKVVENTGYTAEIPAPAAAPQQSPGEEPEYDEHTLALRQRMLVSVALAVPVILLAMVPPLQFPNW